MSRFFKSAAFPILIVVVLAFFAQRLISPGSQSTKPSFSTFLGSAPGRPRQERGPEDQGQHGRRHAEVRQPAEVRDRLPGRLRADPRQQAPARRAVGDHLRRGGPQEQRVALAADLRPAVPDLHRVLDLPDEPGPRRRVEGDVLRQVARQAHERGLAEDHLPRRGRGGRGGGGAPRDQGVPREPQEVPGAGRPDPQGRAALRPAGHRQDAPGPRGRRRGRRAVLLDLGLGLRRDVRRRRRLARARPLRAGQAEQPLHHLHGRDRRRRPPPRRRPRRRSRRARADAQPAARRDGRLRDEGQHHPHRRHQPPRHPRSRAAAPGPLRPPDRGRPARPQRAARKILEVHTRGKPLAKEIDVDALAGQTPASPAPTSPTS